jgi:hypothetical protein
MMDVLVELFVSPVVAQARMGEILIAGGQLASQQLLPGYIMDCR